MEQKDFNSLYDLLYGYAVIHAKQYFHDMPQREEAAGIALDSVIARFNKKGELSGGWLKEWEEAGRDDFEVTNCDLKKAKSRIRSTLRRLSRHQEVESVELSEEEKAFIDGMEGFHAYQLKEG